VAAAILSEELRALQWPGVGSGERVNGAWREVSRLDGHPHEPVGFCRLGQLIEEIIDGGTDAADMDKAIGRMDALHRLFLGSTDVSVGEVSS
jgi:hypothetical protein